MHAAPFASFALAEFLVGWDVLSDYPVGITALLMSGYSFIVLPRKRVFIGWLAGLTVPVCLLLLYNQRCFGTPFTCGYAYHAVYSHHSGVVGIGWPRAAAWQPPAMRLALNVLL